MQANADDPVEQLVRRIYRIGLIQRELARHAAAELGSNGFIALAAVRAGGALRVSEVAQRLGVDLSVASRQVAALQSAGYLERHPDPQDGRASVVEVTEKGVDVLRESHRRMVAAFDGVLDDWTVEEITSLTDGLERLREDFRRANAATPEPQTESTPAP